MYFSVISSVLKQVKLNWKQIYCLFFDVFEETQVLSGRHPLLVTGDLSII